MGTLTTKDGHIEWVDDYKIEGDFVRLYYSAGFGKLVHKDYVEKIEGSFRSIETESKPEPLAALALGIVIGRMMKEV